jgi:hypothetical protein
MVFPLKFSDKNFCVFLISTFRATFLGNHVLPDYITLTCLNADYEAYHFQTELNIYTSIRAEITHTS